MVHAPGKRGIVMINVADNMVVLHYLNNTIILKNITLVDIRYNHYFT